MIRISVVMVNYNYGRYVTEAINSLLTQTRPPDEIVVVDDGSTDDSRDRLVAYRDRTTLIFQKNAGQTAATNVGIATASGDVIAILDSDDLALPDRLAALEIAFAEHPECGWVFHAVSYIDRRTMTALKTPGHIGFSGGVHDHRADVARGKLPITMPPTSGLSWRADFVRRFVPTPTPLGSQDNYLKFLSLAHSPGFVIERPLTLQGIHDANMYTGVDAQARKRFGLVSATQMAQGLIDNGAPALGRRFIAGVAVDSRVGVRLDRSTRAVLWRLLRRHHVGLLPPLVRAAGAAVFSALQRSTHQDDRRQTERGPTS